MKKIIFALVAGVVLLSASTALAADNQSELPSWFTYTKEWLNLNVLTWKSESKVLVLDDLASKRVSDISVADQAGSDQDIEKLADRYLQVKERETNRIETKNISTDTMNMVVVRETERQRTLSRIRQESKSETVKNLIVQVQEEAVNRTKSAIGKKQNETDVENFENNIVAAWRDPEGKIDSNNEKTTRVYAAGTTGEGASGVLIDGGEAKIIQGTSGELKIEYAPGTGPNSVVDTGGSKKWKIQQSNGTVIESYTSSGMVVIGQSGAVSSNVVVNTIAGGTSSSAQTMTGNSGGTSSVIIEGGSRSVQGSAGSTSGSGSGQNVVE